MLNQVIQCFRKLITTFDEFIMTFEDQNGISLEIEDKVNLTLFINRNDAIFYRTTRNKIY